MTSQSTPTTEQRPSHRAIHMAVRNILFNEMGLSREAIHNQVEAEIAGVTNRRFRDLEEVEGYILRAISKVVYGRYSADRIRKMIEDQVGKCVSAYVKKQVDEILGDKLKIEIKA